MLRDLTGYPITCGNEKALKAFNEGASAIVTLRDNGFPMLVEAVKLDGSIVVARCVIVRTNNLQQIFCACVPPLSCYGLCYTIQSMFFLEGLEPPTSSNGTKFHQIYACI